MDEPRQRVEIVAYSTGRKPDPHVAISLIPRQGEGKEG
jgi:hypothetical protein